MNGLRRESQNTGNKTTRNNTQKEIGMDKSRPCVLQNGMYKNQHFVNITSSLLGCAARLCERNGNYDGVLRTFSPKMDVVLDMVHDVNTLQPQSRPNVEKMRMFNSSEVVSMTLLNVDLNYATKGYDSFIDSSIGNTVNGGRREKELEMWEDGEGVEFVTLDTDIVSWSADDMFKTNREKFAVRSTYDESLHQYTIPLEKTDTPEFRRTAESAEQLAKEIESSVGYQHRRSLENSDDVDEEDAYSAVQRPHNSGRNTTSHVQRMMPRRKSDSSQTAAEGPSAMSQRTESCRGSQKVRVRPPLRGHYNTRSMENTDIWRRWPKPSSDVSDRQQSSRFTGIPDRQQSSRFTHVPGRQQSSRIADVTDRQQSSRFTDTADRHQSSRFTDTADRQQSSQFTRSSPQRSALRLANLMHESQSLQSSSNQTPISSSNQTSIGVEAESRLSTLSSGEDVTRVPSNLTNSSLPSEPSLQTDQSHHPATTNPEPLRWSGSQTYSSTGPASKESLSSSSAAEYQTRLSPSKVRSPVSHSVDSRGVMCTPHLLAREVNEAFVDEKALASHGFGVSSNVQEAKVVELREFHTSFKLEDPDKEDPAKVHSQPEEVPVEISTSPVEPRDVVVREDDTGLSSTGHFAEEENGHSEKTLPFQLNPDAEVFVPKPSIPEVETLQSYDQSPTPPHPALVQSPPLPVQSMPGSMIFMRPTPPVLGVSSQANHFSKAVMSLPDYIVGQPLYPSPTSYMPQPSHLSQLVYGGSRMPHPPTSPNPAIQSPYFLSSIGAGAIPAHLSHPQQTHVMSLPTYMQAPHVGSHQIVHVPPPPSPISSQMLPPAGMSQLELMNQNYLPTSGGQNYSSTQSSLHPATTSQSFPINVPPYVLRKLPSFNHHSSSLHGGQLSMQTAHLLPQPATPPNHGGQSMLVGAPHSIPSPYHGAVHQQMMAQQMSNSLQGSRQIQLLQPPPDFHGRNRPLT